MRGSEIYFYRVLRLEVFRGAQGGWTTTRYVDKKNIKFNASQQQDLYRRLFNFHLYFSSFPYTCRAAKKGSF